jgi:hypothetical protein
MSVLGQRMEDTISRRTGNLIEAGFVSFAKREMGVPVFDREGEICVKSSNADRLLEEFRK